MAVIMEMTTLVVEWLLQQSSEDINDGGSCVKNIVWWYKNVYELIFDNLIPVTSEWGFGSCMFSLKTPCK